MTVFELMGKIFIDDNGATKTLDGIDKKAGGLGKTFKSVAKGAGIAAGIVGGAFLAIAGSAVKGMAEAETQVAQLDSVLKSTGGSAGVTKDSVLSLADALEKTTKFSAESTLAASNLLLTFTNIGKDVFPDATKTALDMATALGGDAASQSIALGKALNDPISGITALSRVGVTFSDEQKAVIKSLQETGDMAGAQKVILAELSKEFGGSAEAAGNTFSGGLIRAKNAIDSIVEGLLVGLMPMLQGLLDFVLANMPMIQSVLESVFANFIPMVTQLAKLILPTLLSLFDNMANGSLPALSAVIMGLITSVLPVLIDLFNVFVEDVLPVLIDLFSFIITDILPPVMALFQVLIKTVLPPLLDLFKALVTELLPPVIKLFKEIITAVFPLLIEIVTTVIKSLKPLLDIIIKLIKELLPPLITIFKVLADVFVNNLKMAIDTISKVLDNLKIIFQNIMDFIKNVFTGNWKGAWENVKNIFKSIFDSFEAIVKAPINAVIGLINKAIGAINGLKINVPDWLTDLTGIKDFSFNIPQIPLLAKGGNVTGRGSFISGEAGAELVTMTGSGVTVTPLTNSQKVKDGSTKESKIEVNVMIEKFNNNTDTDIEDLIKEIDFQTKRRFEGGGFAYV